MFKGIEARIIEIVEEFELIIKLQGILCVSIGTVASSANFLPGL